MKITAFTMNRIRNECYYWNRMSFARKNKCTHAKLHLEAAKIGLK
jgi:hypothetical protein